MQIMSPSNKPVTTSCQTLTEMTEVNLRIGENELTVRRDLSLNLLVMYVADKHTKIFNLKLNASNIIRGRPDFVEYGQTGVVNYLLEIVFLIVDLL